MQNRQSVRAPHFILEFTENDEMETISVPHCHEMYEIYCYFSGRVECAAEGVVYPIHPGDILLLNRSVFHNMTATNEGDGYRRVVLHFGSELLHEDERFLLELFSAPNILYPNAWEKGMKDLYQQLRDSAELPEQVRNIAIRTTVVRILVELFAMKGDAIGRQAEQDSIDRVIRYINAHLTEPMTQESLAGQFYMGRNTLTRQFRHATGTTVASYILYKRMALARFFLRAGHPSGEVAQECGFADYSTFYRGYKKIFGQSPSIPLHGDWEPDPTALEAPEELL